MKNIVISVVIMVICVPLNANSQEGRGNLQFHGSGGVSGGAVDPATGEIGLAKVIKNIRLPSHSSKTFGEAVDSYRYFTKKVWKETKSTDAKIYVDFTGWFKKSSLDISTVSSQGIGIKFLVKPDGTYGVVMVSKVELRTDGNIYSEPLPDIQSILNKLYGNKEIKF
jgi:hypothetical protein